MFHEMESMRLISKPLVVALCEHDVAVMAIPRPNKGKNSTIRMSKLLCSRCDIEGKYTIF